MNKHPMSWPIALLHVCLRLASHLPLSSLHALGAGLGRVLWWSNRRPRRIVERNLSLVLTQDDAKTRQTIARSALVETGRAVAEVAKVWSGRPDHALRFVRQVHGAARLDAAIRRGRGVIIAAPHLGCWELLSYWLAARTPLAIVYRAPRRTWLEPLLLRARGASGIEQVRAEGASVRSLYRRLAAGGVVGILPDQQPRQGEGAWAPFFGVPVLTMVLIARLARRTGAEVILAFAERLPKSAGFDIHVLPAPDGIADADLEVACSALNRGIESCVRLAFTQYQWAYKRFPREAGAPRP
ncbi:MAG: lipid A biosynthesis acyltransferase [Rhodanobacteraceae bacterium]